MTIQIPESPVKTKHDVVVNVNKIYPYELEECKPKIDTQWSWTYLKTIHIKLHRKYGDKVEIDIIKIE